MARTKQSSAQGGTSKVFNKSSSHKLTQTQRAGLTLPVARIHRHLRKDQGLRVSAGAAVYLASVMEYLTTELIELSGSAAIEHKKTRISPRFLNLAIRHDEELAEMFKNVTIAEGGVKPQMLVAPPPKKD